jgi:hypothetical protein
LICMSLSDTNCISEARLAHWLYAAPQTRLAAAVCSVNLFSESYKYYSDKHIGIDFHFLFHLPKSTFKFYSTSRPISMKLGTSLSKENLSLFK